MCKTQIVSLPRILDMFTVSPVYTKVKSVSRTSVSLSPDTVFFSCLSTHWWTSSLSLEYMLDPKCEVCLLDQDCLRLPDPRYTVPWTRLLLSSPDPLVDPKVIFVYCLQNHGSRTIVCRIDPGPMIVWNYQWCSSSTIPVNYWKCQSCPHRTYDKVSDIVMIWVSR